MSERDPAMPSAAPTRSQFRCLDELVNHAIFMHDMRGFSDQQAASIRALLRWFGGQAVDEFAHAVEKGTERALAQTAKVFTDPNYYTVTKKLRAETRRRQSERNKAEREKARLEYLQPATPLQIGAKRRHLILMAEYHENEAARFRKEREEFEKSPEVFHAAAMNVPVKGVV